MAISLNNHETRIKALESSPKSTFSYTVLWSGRQSGDFNVTIPQSIRNFTTVMIIFEGTSYGAGFSTAEMLVNDLIELKSLAVYGLENDNTNITYETDTSLTLHGYRAYMRKVIGVKY